MAQLLLNEGAHINARSGYQREHRCATGPEESEVDSDFDFGYARFGFGDEICLFGSLPFSIMPPIFIAAIRGNWETVELLLYQGADPNPTWGACNKGVLEREISSPTISVFTPLQAAVLAGYVIMTQKLLDFNVHIDARAQGNQGYTALQIAVMIGSERLVELRLSKGADINAPAGILYGNTAVQAASRLLDTNILKLLLKKGADVNAAPSNKGGKTALQFAVLAGNIEGVELLLDSRKGTNFEPDFTDKLFALENATYREDLTAKKELVHLLTEKGLHASFPMGISQNASLHTLIMCGDLAITRKRLEQGISSYLSHLSHCAKSNPKPPALQQTLARGGRSLVDLLIQYGAGKSSIVDSLSKHPICPIHGADIETASASPDGISPIEEIFRSWIYEPTLSGMPLEQFPDATVSRSALEHTAVGLALRRALNHISFINLMLKAGASFRHNERCTRGIPAIQQAVSNGFYVFQYILDVSANSRRRWMRGGPYDVTAFQVADSSSRIDQARSLPKMAADVNATTYRFVRKTDLMHIDLMYTDANGLSSPVRGHTALQLAASHRNVKMTKYLIACGAVNAAAASEGGLTAIQAAAIEGNIRIVEILLRHGADIDGASAIEEGRTAIEGAAEHGRFHTLQLLLEKHPYAEDFDIKRKRAARFAQANGHVAIERFLLAYRKQPQV